MLLVYGVTLFMLYGFSALQRAENSSMIHPQRPGHEFRYRFSALQRAENSSICVALLFRRLRVIVSVLFSEPKIPQYEKKEFCV